MIELHTDDWYEITGRGIAASFAKGCLPTDVKHPWELIGQTVRIDGNLYEVKGVEHWAIVCPRGDGTCEHPFGLALTEASC